MTPGASEIPGGVPVFGVSAVHAPLVVGTRNGQEGIAVIWTIDAGPKWAGQQLGDTERWPEGAAELDDGGLLGDRVLVVGQDVRAEASTTPEKSFAVVYQKDGLWHVSDISAQGQSVELRAIGVTGDATDMNTFFIAVGARKDEAPAGQYLDEDVTGAMPFAQVTVNGTDWNPPVDLPLPDGVTGAEAVSVTYAGPSTPAPGVLAAGIGLVSDPALGTREVGIVWRSTDDGGTWKVVSDRTFDTPGRNMNAQFVAADSSHVVVTGGGDASASSSQGQDVQRGTLFWGLQSDGTWNRSSDASSLKSTVSSTPTALAARKDGGFLSASQYYQTMDGPRLPGGDAGTKAAALVFSAPDGAAWQDVTDSKIRDGALLVNGIAETDKYDIFVGMDASGAGASWALDRSAIR